MGPLFIECDCGEVFATKDQYAKHIHDINAADPGKIHRAEQNWEAATQGLSRIVEHIRDKHNVLTHAAGGNSDVSVTFDYVHQWIRRMESESPTPELTHHMTVMWCAAAITRLVHASGTESSLAQLDWETPDIGDTP